MKFTPQNPVERMREGRLPIVIAGYFPKLLVCSLAVFGLPGQAPQAAPFADAMVGHSDPVVVDNSLSLAKLLALTLERFPDTATVQALEEEAAAILQRSKSWTAGASQAGLRFQEATSGTLHYIDATVEVPLWNIGQRDAEKNLADQAEASTLAQTEAIKLRVAGLVRGALWDMTLQNIRYQQAKEEVGAFEKLYAKVGKRVELGDVPRADLLLAQTELLQKRSAMILAEAELMHSRKRYASITLMNKVPASYQESLAGIKEIQGNHPALMAINSQISRKQSELDALELVGSGQTKVIVGVNSDSLTNDPRSNKTESFNIGVTMPFGGSDHIKPHLAAVNVELNKLLAQRAQLYRDLEQMHHEAEHNLEVNRAELAIANELKQVAEQHLGMTQLSYAAGEINLMDLLKIQSRTNLAILNAKERAVILQRDLAFYNQAVGVLP
jgi:outer membrane protein TolC